MCGRVDLGKTEQLVDWFAFSEIRLTLREPKWNVAPTRDLPVLMADGTEHRAEWCRWGLIPAWSKTPTTKYATFNARIETAATAPAFRDAWKRRHCVVVVNGFYEWDKSTDPKTPYHIARADGTALAFAGLWEQWSGDGKALTSCTILTMPANAQMAQVHTRMPVVLEPEHVAAWLADHGTPPTPADGVLEMHRVSRAVGNVRNDGPELVERID